MNPLFKFKFKCGLSYNGSTHRDDTFYISVKSRNLVDAREKVYATLGDVDNLMSARWLAKIIDIEECE